MGRLVSGVLLLVGLHLPGVVAQAQALHDVRIDAHAERDQYRFLPATVVARPGDVVRFRAGKGAPHSIVFEGSGLSPQARMAPNNTMGGRAGDLTSPLLTEEGSEYRIVVPALPPGRYEFFCLPHRAYDLRGALIVK